MPVLRVRNFDGLVPRTDAYELADNQAQVSLNTKLYSRELRPWRGPAVVGSPFHDGTIYKLYNYSGGHTWLNWEADVDVALSPQADTGDIRFYYTGDGAPKKSNYVMAQGADPPETYQEMGVPAPVAPPTLTLTTDGTGTEQTRAYVYTFVNTFGSIQEESAPSPPETITVKPNGSTVTLSLFDDQPSGAYSFTHIRIYRSVTGASTSSYQFVAEIPISTPTYADSLTVAELGGVIETIGWRPPPSDLKGILNVGSGTGVLAGFTGNTVCFSQPFFPHAWPIAYQLTVPYRIVGLGAIGSAVVVMTDGYPYIVNGGTPGSMYVERVPILEPCVAKRSIVPMGDGLIYASPNGLVNIGAGARGNTTIPLFHREEWQALSPQYIQAGALANKYVAVFTDGPKINRALVFDPSDTPSLCEVAVAGRAVHVDTRDAKVYYVNELGTAINELDGNAAIPLPYTWRSKRWRFPQAIPWSALKVEGDHGEGTLVVNIYGDGVLVQSVSPTSNEPVRLVSFKPLDFYFELIGTRGVRSVTFATSVAELRQ